METFSTGGRERARDFVSQILKTIPGQKIVTVTSDIVHEFIIDIAADGTIGYDPNHEEHLNLRLSEALSSSGAAIVRQFTPIKVERLLPNGKRMFIPQKNVFGFLLKNNDWYGLSAAALADAYRTDAKTGEKLTPEPDILYRDAPF